MPFFVVPMDDPPSSISLSPSTIWWKPRTRCARSEMNRRSAQGRPGMSYVLKGLTFALQGIELVEQGRNVDHHSRADESEAFLVDQAWSQCHLHLGTHHSARD